MASDIAHLRLPRDTISRQTSLSVLKQINNQVGPRYVQPSSGEIMLRLHENLYFLSEMGYIDICKYFNGCSVDEKSSLVMKPRRMENNR